MTRFLAVTILALLALPTGTALGATNAPPGFSGIDQYLETVPESTGNRTPGKRASSASRGQASTSGRPASHGGLTSAQVRSLRQAGSDGEAVIGLSERTGPLGKALPERAGGREQPGGSREGEAPVGSEAEEGGSGGSLADSVATSVVGSGTGMGPVLPILLVVSAVFAAAVALGRRRTT